MNQVWDVSKIWNRIIGISARNALQDAREEVVAPVGYIDGEFAGNLGDCSDF